MPPMMNADVAALAGTGTYQSHRLPNGTVVYLPAIFSAVPVGRKLIPDAPPFTTADEAMTYARLHIVAALAAPSKPVARTWQEMALYQL